MDTLVYAPSVDLDEKYRAEAGEIFYYRRSSSR